MKFYTVATKESRCFGHGDNRDVWVIQQSHDGKWPPVFLEESEAVKWVRFSGLGSVSRIIQMEVVK